MPGINCLVFRIAINSNRIEFNRNEVNNKKKTNCRRKKKEKSFDETFDSSAPLMIILRMSFSKRNCAFLNVHFFSVLLFVHAVAKEKREMNRQKAISSWRLGDRFDREGNGALHI